jgi:hypothetical protein
MIVSGHICHTCASDSPSNPTMKFNSKLVNCTQCPTAYHSGEFCIAAGKFLLGLLAFY